MDLNHCTFRKKTSSEGSEHNIGPSNPTRHAHNITQIKCDKLKDNIFNRIEAGQTIGAAKDQTIQSYKHAHTHAHICRSWPNDFKDYTRSHASSQLGNGWHT